MRDACGRIHFSLDMNFDGATTISDFGLLLQSAFLLPANLVTVFFDNIPALAKFFEVTCGTSVGIGGGIFSFIVWGFVYLIIVASGEADRTIKRTKEAGERIKGE